MLFILLSFLLVSSPTVDKSYAIHEVKAKNGDGVYSLLRRYDLDKQHCNVVQFYELNKMSLDSKLHTGRQYKLPVYLYTYNGVSIRSTIGNNDLDLAERIKEYNDNLHATGKRKTKYTDSKILWVPYHVMTIKGIPKTSKKTADANIKSKITKKTNVASSISSTKNSLFGNKYEKFEKIDNSLKNQVFYVVSGHGGIDPGAQCKQCPTNLCEDEYAYDVALRLARDLLQHGALVEVIVQDKNDGIRDARYLKCDQDEVYIGNKKIHNSQKQRLRKRASIINELYVKHKKRGVKEQKAVFIHVDSQNSSKRQDVYFFHAKGSNSGEKLANNIQQTFENKYAKYQKNRGYKGFVKARNLYVLNFTSPTAVFIELANIRNKADHQRLILESNRQALANWIFEGLTE